ncbi:glycosyltransferase family 76 protein [Mycena alexandri]|uniref:GPI mannosyltransferase 2 n=1 Tax=Mycena alexandri TaxID=1745969 RepID=A0AAD6T4W4_9AGAR|nr:glycosyltransferase family 76 protein [Mycena alexandri]
MSHNETNNSTTRTLLALTVVSRLAAAALLLLAPLFSPFDAATPHLLLRWDAIHFLHIARSGYVYEHEWAFLPGPPFLLSLLPNSIVAPTILSLAVACDASLTMYALSLHHLGSPALAKLATILSLLPSSPATLFLAPYTEPFFTYLSYKGMLYCARSRYLAAAVAFTIAAALRSNGFLLSGFVIWGLLIRPVLERKPLPLSSVLNCVVLSALPFTPFIAHNYAAYLAFCTADPPAAWCARRLPLIYSHVQEHYWNSGFLRYWTLEQLPNFLIAAPPLLAISAFSVHQLRRWMKSPAGPAHAFLSPSIAPHAIHALIMSAILLFASHTQIVLRLAAAMPITYWAAAWLLLEHPKLGRAWVAWSVLWGALSVLLWGAFLPPA